MASGRCRPRREGRSTKSVSDRVSRNRPPEVEERKWLDRQVSSSCRDGPNDPESAVGPAALPFPSARSPRSRPVSSIGCGFAGPTTLRALLGSPWPARAVQHSTRGRSSWRSLVADGDSALSLRVGVRERACIGVPQRSRTSADTMTSSTSASSAPDVRCRRVSVFAPSR